MERPRFKMAGPGKYGIGLVRVDAERRSVVFPAEINQREGPVEYAVVTRGGKVHESFLVTEAEPHDIHAGMLLLRVALPEMPKVPPPPPNVDGAYLRTAPEPKGAPVRVTVHWHGAEGAEARALDTFLGNARTGGAMSPGPWVYTGSMPGPGGLLASSEGSVIGIVADPSTLVGNPREGRDDDSIWSVRGAGLPPPGTKVFVEVQLEQEKPDGR